MRLPEPHRLLCAVILLVLSRGTDAAAQAPDDRQPQQLAEDCRVAEQMLLYQRDTGGWPKNTDMKRPLSPDERTQILRDKRRRDDSSAEPTTACTAVHLPSQTGFIPLAWLLA